MSGIEIQKGGGSCVSGIKQNTKKGSFFLSKRLRHGQFVILAAVIATARPEKGRLLLAASVRALLSAIGARHLHTPHFAVEPLPQPE